MHVLFATGVFSNIILLCLQQEAEVVKPSVPEADPSILVTDSTLPPPLSSTIVSIEAVEAAADDLLRR